MKHKRNTQLVSGFTPAAIAKKHRLNTQLVRGFTLIEVIVSSVLIGITLISLANLFVAGKRYILHSRSRMTGGELGKLFLGPLQMHVRQDTWDLATNNLRGGTRYCDSAHSGLQQQNCPTLAERTLGGIEYNAKYDISAPFSPSDLRKVVTTISWTEESAP
ncbi:MAG: prepilin-type N-terminal cleavage/methylation domain-containing protein [Candidatus Omnitrophica bacterium]|nr:prepilin-type N-terminal cleavage/methylation domain-containing protein [Candidatus Omnitrophota bacterium]